MRSILFLCTGNSCRSQMALGFMRSLHPDWQSESAGLEAHGLNPLAAAVMAELGIDISEQPSRNLDSLRKKNSGELPAFDFVATVCGHAHETCPHWPAVGRIIHHGFDDPPSLARGIEDREQVLNIYRRVRDEIRDWVTGLPAELGIHGGNDGR